MPIRFSEQASEAWFEVPLGRGWLAAYRLEPQGGRVVFGELRVFPKGAEGKLPPGGLTTETLKALHPGAHREQMLRQIGSVTLRAEDFQAPEQPGRGKRRSDRFYAELAAVYAEAVRAGNTRPIATIAQQTGLGRNYVRDALREARRLGFLTGTKERRAGGRLTAKARRILRQANEDEGGSK